MTLDTRVPEKRKAGSGVDDVRSVSNSHNRKRRQRRHGTGRGKRTCTFCYKNGHEEADCYKKKNALRRHNG
jgi:hypothetical protein